MGGMRYCTDDLVAGIILSKFGGMCAKKKKIWWGGGRGGCLEFRIGALAWYECVLGDVWIWMIFFFFDCILAFSYLLLIFII